VPEVRPADSRRTELLLPERIVVRDAAGHERTDTSLDEMPTDLRGAVEKGTRQPRLIAARRYEACARARARQSVRVWRVADVSTLIR
jgi:hypothetical protein